MAKSLSIAAAAILLFFWIALPAYQTAAAALETVSASLEGTR